MVRVDFIMAGVPYGLLLQGTQNSMESSDVMAGTHACASLCMTAKILLGIRENS